MLLFLDVILYAYCENIFENVSALTLLSSLIFSLLALFFFQYFILHAVKFITVENWKCIYESRFNNTVFRCIFTSSDLFTFNKINIIDIFKIFFVVIIISKMFYGNKVCYVADRLKKREKKQKKKIIVSKMNGVDTSVIIFFIDLPRKLTFTF